MQTFEYTLNREGGEIEVTVTGEYQGASRGYRNSLGVPEEPDEDAFFEIDEITDEDGNAVEVSDSEMASISAYCQESIETDYDDRDYD